MNNQSYSYIVHFFNILCRLSSYRVDLQVQVYQITITLPNKEHEKNFDVVGRGVLVETHTRQPTGNCSNEGRATRFGPEIGQIGPKMDQI